MGGAPGPVSSGRAGPASACLEALGRDTAGSWSAGRTAESSRTIPSPPTTPPVIPPNRPPARPPALAACKLMCVRRRPRRGGAGDGGGGGGGYDGGYDGWGGVTGVMMGAGMQATGAGAAGAGCTLRDLGQLVPAAGAAQVRSAARGDAGETLWGGVL